MPELESERRIFERFSARFPVKIKDSRYDYGTEIFLRDASAEGIMLVSKDRIFVNDTLSLLVELPDGQSPLPLNGKVVWSRPNNSRMWDIGVKFHKVDLMKIHRLFKYTL